MKTLLTLSGNEVTGTGRLGFTVANARAIAPPSLVTSGQGWLAARLRYGYARAAEPGGNTAFEVLANITDGTNYIRVMYRESSDDWRCRISNGTTTWDAAVASGVFIAEDPAVVVAKWATVSGVVTGWISVNGSAFSPVTPGPTTLAPFTVTSFDIGSAAGSQPVMASLEWFACGKGGCTDAEAAKLATVAGPPNGYITSDMQMTGCFPQWGIGRLDPPITIVS